ncbi:MAG: hypothetical protein NZ734_09845, partial [Paracoccus sp.]|nr:hypothetical protein [Paracoccus sp. (in: a-proteobacteria)]
ALSNPEGWISLDLAAEDEMVRFRWREHGAHIDKASGPQTGFGSRLIELAVKQQLGGNYERTWHDDGVELVMDVRKSRLQEPS